MLACGKKINNNDTLTHICLLPDGHQPCNELIFSSADFGFLKLFFAGSYTGNLHHHVQKLVDFICI